MQTLKNIPVEYVMHVRLFDERVKYATKGGLTLVIIDGVFFGFTKCSLKDNYNKKQGRIIARGRAIRVKNYIEKWGQLFFYANGGLVDGILTNAGNLVCTVETALVEAGVSGWVVIHNAIYNLDINDNLNMVGGIIESPVDGLYKIIMNEKD